MLQHAVDEQERLTNDGHAVAIEEIGTDDDVRYSGLVLEREEHEALRGAGALPRDAHAGDAHATAVAHARPIGGAHHTLQLETAAAQRHRMRPDREAGAGVVGMEPLPRVHGLERTLGSW